MTDYTFTIAPSNGFHVGQLIHIDRTLGFDGTFEITAIVHDEITVHEPTIWRLIENELRGLRVHLTWWFQDAWKDLQERMSEV